ncbi:MAG: hypothetical protein L6406_15545 [Desulfobacterales bacterium]|nr:hypothetical protein [Desulfobacterales bacterium]
MLEKKIADKEKSGVHIGSILRKYQAFQGAALYDRERSGLPTHCHTLQDISGAWGYPLPAFLKRLRKKKKDTPLQKEVTGNRWLDSRKREKWSLFTDKKR